MRTSTRVLGLLPTLVLTALTIVAAALGLRTASATDDQPTLEQFLASGAGSYEIAITSRECAPTTPGACEEFDAVRRESGTLTIDPESLDARVRFERPASVSDPVPDIGLRYLPDGDLFIRYWGLPDSCWRPLAPRMREATDAALIYAGLDVLREAATDPVLATGTPDASRRKVRVPATTALAVLGLDAIMLQNYRVSPEEQVALTGVEVPVTVIAGTGADIAGLEVVGEDLIPGLVPALRTWSDPQVKASIVINRRAELRLTSSASPPDIERPDEVCEY